MKALLNKKIMIIIGGLLTALLFTALGMSIANIIERSNSNSNKSNMQISAWSGSGTEDSPYLITSISDMNTLSTNIANGNEYYETYFKLTKDLDYSSVSNFCPIGATMSGTVMTEVNYFCGVFDGDGHVVSNLKTTITEANITGIGHHIDDKFVHIGFFAGLGYLDADDSYYQSDNDTNGYYYYNYIATVKNLKIKNFEVTNSFQNYTYIGGIAGVARTYGTTITHSSGVNDSTKNFHVFTFGVKIDQCVVDGLTVDDTGYESYISGLVGCQRLLGENQLGGSTIALTISNCMVLDPSITATGAGSLVALISPAYSIDGEDSIYDLSFPNFAYYYDISDCYTDNRSYYTFFGAIYDGYDATPYHGYYYNANKQPDGYSSQSDVYQKIGNVFYDITLACYNGFDESIWTFHEFGEWGYLTQFLTEVSYGVNDTAMGSVDDISYEDTHYLPKGDSPYVDGDNLCYFYLDGKYVFTLSPIPNAGYKFKEWSLGPSRFIAYFVEDGIEITFDFVTGTGVTESETYKVASETTIIITYEPFGKEGAYKKCYFTFIPIDESNNITITYEITDITKYIKKAKAGDSLIESNSYTVTEEMTFSVELADRNYDIEVGEK